MRYRMGGIGVLVSAFAFGLISCATLPKPNQLVAPAVVIGNSGKFMCPYTQDDTVAEWVDMGMTARAASAIGGAIGREAGSMVIESIPFIGGWLGGKSGKAAAKAIAIKACGGWERIKSSSNLSFNSFQDMAVWLYVTKSERKEFKDVLDLTCGIYPDLCEDFNSFLKKAYKQQNKR